MANGPGWTFLRHHAHVRHCIATHREVGVLLDLILRPDQPDTGEPEIGPVATRILAEQRLQGVEPA
jgi:hypothetical protein